MIEGDDPLSSTDSDLGIHASQSSGDDFRIQVRWAIIAGNRMTGRLPIFFGNLAYRLQDFILETIEGSHPGEDLVYFPTKRC